MGLVVWIKGKRSEKVRRDLPKWQKSYLINLTVSYEAWTVWPLMVVVVRRLSELKDPS